MVKESFSCLIACAALLSIFAGAASAENWPRFRGPNGQGVSAEKGIPATWSQDDLAWKTDLGGSGHSSPVTWGGKVFVTVTDKETSKCALLAVALSDGGILWKNDYAVAPSRKHFLNSDAAMTPAVDADAVYTIWQGAGQIYVVAVDHQGKELWRRDDFGPMHARHGYGSSPIVYKDMVVLTLEQEENDAGLQGHWYALDRRTGATKWRIARDNTANASSSTPCVYPGPNGKDWLIFTSFAHGITAVDPESGAVVWEQSSAMPARVVSSPVLAGGVIVSSCGKGGKGVQLTAVAPPAKGASSAAIQYALQDRHIQYVSTAVAVKDWLFVFNDQGRVTCMDGATGNTIWSEEPGGKFYCSPVVVEDRIYCVNMDGEVVVLRASDKYECLGVNPLGEKSQASPAIAQGRIIFRTDTQLHCLAAETV